MDFLKRIWRDLSADESREQGSCLSWADKGLLIFQRKRGDMVERMKNGKRFVRYKEGAEMYSMCQSKFEQMAKDAKAVYKVDKLVLVNCDIFEAYLETFRLYV